MPKAPKPWPAATALPIADYRRALRPAGRQAQGVLAIEGWRLVERAVAAGVWPTTVLSTAAFVAQSDTRQATLVASLSARTDLRRGVVDDATISDLVGGRTFGDIVAMVPIPVAFDLASWCRDTTASSGAVLVLVDVVDPGNIGALARTALATGIDALVVVGGADPFHPKALRTSMGALFRLPVARVDSPFNTFAAAGVQTVGTVTAGGIAPWQSELHGRVAIVVGGEAFGLSDAVAGTLDTRVTIEMAPRVDSFSVSAAAAILLYERNRQQRERG
ncbi:MAG: TrmH family RNA methyltransferase [Myxococcota bacterium]|jgi:TrmH family RNA methyltransferase